MMPTPSYFLAALFACTLLGGSLQAQPDGRPTLPLQKSENGWFLSTHGTMRVLVLFAEIDWDVDRGNDPNPDGSDHWPKGQLPKWKDDLFDPHPLPIPRTEVSRYYHDVSLGHYTMLGDYVDQLFVLRQSEHRSIRNAHGINRIVIEEANKLGSLRTKNGLGIADFDLWKRGGRPGQPKAMGADDPHSYDHVMVILRNSTLTHGQGSVDPGSSGRLFGYESDSQSRFGAMNSLPFEILKHEFNHMLLGGNNFHSGGGNAAMFQSYFIPIQGGWSLMGSASSSLLTCCAWDRDRMNWKPEGAVHRIRARDPAGREVNSDLDPIAGDTGLYVLRDFVNTGDALRIRMPFLPEDGHQQWLWVENHLGYKLNGSPTDRFHWELEQPCMGTFEPGLFMMMQVDREDREGQNIFAGHADHLRPVLANGNYDFSLRGDTVHGSCPFGGSTYPFIMDERWANPLSGNHEQELPAYDRNGDGIVEGGEHWIPRMRVRKGRVEAEGVFYGHPDHGFRMDGNRKLAMGTNPSSANMMTLVSAAKNDSYRRGKPNVRSIHLNGISVELISVAANGDATVRVRSGDVLLDRDVRWAADSIVLPALRGAGNDALVLASKRTLLLDRSRTPTRIDAPEKDAGRMWFSEPTSMSVLDGAVLRMEPKSKLAMHNGSTLHLLPGSKLLLQGRVCMKIESGSAIVVHAGAQVEGPEKLLQKLRKRGTLRDQ